LYYLTVTLVIFCSCMLHLYNLITFHH
jgi:hypothetical protein